MSKPLQILIAITCIAVLAWVGLSFTESRNHATAEQSAARAAETRFLIQLERCRSDVQAWDAGNTKPARKRFGDRAETGIETCRQLVDLSGAK